MAETQRTIVVYNAVQVVARFNLEPVHDEALVRCEGRKVQVSDGKVDQVLQLAPLVTVEAETLELDDEDWWRDKNVKSLEVDLVLLAFVAGDFVLQLLCLVELGQAILEGRVVRSGLICHLCVSFLAR